MDFQNLPAGTPVWVITIFVLGSIGLTFTEKAAKIKGPLGAAARWWNRRQEREVERKQSLDARVEALVSSRVESRMQGFTTGMASLEEQVKTLREDLDKERNERRRERAELVSEHRAEVNRLREEDQSKYQYILYLSGRLREYRLWAAEHGYELPPPPIPSYLDWVQEQSVSPPRPREPPPDSAT